MQSEELKERITIHKTFVDRYDKLLTELRKEGRGDEIVADNYRIVGAYHRGAYDAYRSVKDGSV